MVMYDGVYVRMYCRCLVIICFVYLQYVCACDSMLGNTYMSAHLYRADMHSVYSIDCQVRQ